VTSYLIKIKTSALYKMTRGFEILIEGADVFIKGSEILSGVIGIFVKGFNDYVKGFNTFNEGFKILDGGIKDFNKGFHVIDKGIKKTSKAKFVASPRTRSSTFAIRTKPTLKPKIAKELALLQPHMASLLHLESDEKQMIKK
jgi:hypothetical protein